MMFLFLPCHQRESRQMPRKLLGMNTENVKPKTKLQSSKQNLVTDLATENGEHLLFPTKGAERIETSAISCKRKGLKYRHSKKSTKVIIILTKVIV